MIDFGEEKLRDYLFYLPMLEMSGLLPRHTKESVQGLSASNARTIGAACLLNPTPDLLALLLIRKEIQEKWPNVQQTVIQNEKSWASFFARKPWSQAYRFWILKKMGEGETT